MPQWQGKSRGTPLGYRFFVFVCQKFGIRSAYLVLYFVAFYFLLFSPTSSKNIFRYYKKRHRYGAVRSILMIYRSYFVFGQTLLDKVVVMAGIRNPFTFEFDGEHHLREMVAGGKGGILFSGHVGNWEAAGHLLRRLDTAVNIVLFDGEHQQIKNYLGQVTGKKNFNVIVIKNDLSHVFMIGEALQRNEIICIHADRYMEGNKTITKEFLGANAKFPAGPFTLAAAFDVPVSIVFSFKDSATHYHLYGSHVIRKKPGEGKGVYSARLTEMYVQGLEKKLRQYPAQWFNFYNFWND